MYIMRVLTGALVLVFVDKGGFGWDECRKGWWDDVYYTLVVRKSAGKNNFSSRRHFPD